VAIDRLATDDEVHGGEAFDRIATQYDMLFSHSTIGQAQRWLVHRELGKVFVEGDRILDFNCGTGEDALLLGARGVEVFGCDASAAMIDVCRRKLATSKARLPVVFNQCANENLERVKKLGPFDGAISNFGGLNCSGDLGGLRKTLAALLAPGSSLFLCLMGRTCAWEIAWYLLKANWRKAFRRLGSSGSTASIGGASIRIHYYSTRAVERAFAPSFRLKNRRGVGVVVPPSWLEPWFHNRASAVRSLRQLDDRFGGWPGLRGLADHTLLHFVRRPE